MRKFIAPGIKRFVIDVPRIAKKHQAGQFVILRLHERGERIPITIESSDREKGTIRIVVQAVGKTTYELNALKRAGRFWMWLGRSASRRRLKSTGRWRCWEAEWNGVGLSDDSGVEESGNRILTILGGRSRELVLLEKEMREVSDALYVTTDDGSYGEKGLVTDKLRELIGKGEPIQLVAGGGAGADDESGCGPKRGSTAYGRS